MRKFGKRLLAISLALCLTMALLPGAALAEELPELTPEAEETAPVPEETPEEEETPPEEQEEPEEGPAEEPAPAEPPVAAESTPAVTADADAPTSGTCGAEGDNLTWTLENDVLTISGSGAMKDYGYYEAPGWRTISGIREIRFEGNVTYIGKYAFTCMYSLETVTVPDTVTSMGYDTFNDSTLRSITLSKNLTEIPSGAFEDCSKLDTVEIPDSVKEISGGAFRGSALSSLVVPASVERVGYRAFSGCSSLLSVVFENPDTRFDDSGEIFASCSRLEELKLPAHLTTIPQFTFEACGLKHLELPDTLRTIGEDAFQFAGIVSLTLPPSVTEICHRAFANCYYLEEITLPPSMRIDDTEYLFGYNTSLKRIILPKGVTSLGPLMFSGCSSLTLLGIPDTVTSIDSKLFSDRTNQLSSVYFGGTEAQWRTLTTGLDDDSKKALEKACIHFECDLSEGEGTNAFYMDPLVRYQSTMDTSSLGVRSLDGLVFYDGWFKKDSYEYNHELATMSLGAAMAGMGSPGRVVKYENIKELYAWLDFRQDAFKAVGYESEDNNTVALAMSWKEIFDENGRPVPLLAVVLRGADYGGGGWAGNFNVGALGDHAGFEVAANNAYTQIRQYLDEQGLREERGDLRIWLTGFSRSAATASLLSTMLRPALCTDEHIYTYTFATPYAKYADSWNSAHQNIFNIVNPLDIVPMIPLADWGFCKPGRTLVLPDPVTAFTEQMDRFRQRFTELSGYGYRYTSGQEWALIYLTQTIGDTLSRHDFFQYLQNDLMKIEFGETNEGLNSLLKKLSGGVISDTTAFANLLLNGGAGLKVQLAAAYAASPSWFKELIGRLLAMSTLSIGESEDGLNRQLLTLIGDLLLYAKNPYDKDSSAAKSSLLMQHWPEVYMAWMMDLEGSNLYERPNCQIVLAACPVDLEVYDEAGELLARSITTPSTVNIDGKKETVYVSEIKFPGAWQRIRTAVFGSSKLFKLPSGQHYRFEIKTNGASYQKDDTMSYTVTSYEGGVNTRSVTYHVPLSVDSKFTGTVTPVGQKIATCTLTAQGQDLEPVSVREALDSVWNAKLRVTRRNGSDYAVTGTLADLSQDAKVYAAAYSEDGKLLAVGHQAVSSADQARTVEISLPGSGEAGRVDLFLLDENAQPLVPKVSRALA